MKWHVCSPFGDSNEFSGRILDDKHIVGVKDES
jgi:hypothetical protein